ncbi:MAG: hypothetical protein Q8L48_31470 [Archangium sp.]|nr:hypothetical protein [Archangium sp.]
MPNPIGPRPVTAPGVNTPAAPPRTVDVGSITRDELARLKQSSPALARTIEQAKSTYGDFLSRTPAARLTVTTPSGNGGAPVLTLLPPGFDASKPATVQTHFHGDHTSVAAPNGSHTGNIKEQLTKEPQRVWVLPEAQGNVGGAGTAWNNVKDHAGTVRDALAGAGVSAASGTKHVVSAHSAGGRALAAAMTSGTLKTDQLVLLDCLYEREAGPGANTAILDAVKNGALAQVKDVVIVATGSYPAERNDKLIAAGSGKVRMEKLMPRQGLSNHEAAARNHLVPKQSWS